MKIIHFYYENHNSGESGYSTIMLAELTEEELIQFDYEDMLVYHLRFLSGSNNFSVKIEWIKDCKIN